MSRRDYEIVEQVGSPLGELTLRRYTIRREVGYEIRLEGRFLMATHGSHSERAMARLARERLSPPSPTISILIGGLGAGQTLDAALGLRGVERVVVTEMSETIVRWATTHFADVNHGALADPRVDLRVAELFEWLGTSDETFDLILNDVDNGPEALASPANERLYRAEGLGLLRSRLRPGGVLAVWASRHDPEHLAAIRELFPDAEAYVDWEQPPLADEPPDCVYLGVRPPG